VFGGSLPSKKDGRRVNVLAGIDPDGNWHIEKEDTGPEHGNTDPILFVPFGGIDYALTMDDLKEMMAGMRERHVKWREQRPPTPDLTAAWKEFYSAVRDYQRDHKVARTRYSITGKEFNGGR
jgi:hypothetical protein